MFHSSTRPPWNSVQDGENPSSEPVLRPPSRQPPSVVVVSVEPFALWAHRWNRHASEATGAAAPPHDTSRDAPLAASDDGHTIATPDSAARAAGIETGMSVAGARQRVPELVVLPSGGPDVDAAWTGFLNELYDLSPRITPLRTGVAALAGDTGDAARLAEQVGGRVGAAATLEEAWLLAYLVEPGHARTVTPGDDPWRILDPAPVYLLGGLGLSPAQRERLAWLGVDTIGALRRWTPAQLVAYLGEEGRALLPALHGPRRDRIPYHAPPDVITVHHAFDDPACEPFEWQPILARLVETAAEQLGERSAERVRVIASGAGLHSDATRRAKAPLRDPVRLHRLACLALNDAGLTALGLDDLRIELSGLARRAAQGELWAQRRRRRQAAAAIHARFPGQARSFVLHDPDAFRARLRWRLRDVASGDAVPWPGPSPRSDEVRRPTDAPAPVPLPVPVGRPSHGES